MSGSRRSTPAAGPSRRQSWPAAASWTALTAWCPPRSWISESSKPRPRQCRSYVQLRVSALCCSLASARLVRGGESPCIVSVGLLGVPHADELGRGRMASHGLGSRSACRGSWGRRSRTPSRNVLLRLSPACSPSLSSGFWCFCSLGQGTCRVGEDLTKTYLVVSKGSVQALAIGSPRRTPQDPCFRHSPLCLRCCKCILAGMSLASAQRFWVLWVCSATLRSQRQQCHCRSSRVRRPCWQSTSAGRQMPWHISTPGTCRILCPGTPLARPTLWLSHPRTRGVAGLRVQLEVAAALEEAGGAEGEHPGESDSIRGNCWGIGRG